MVNKRSACFTEKCDYFTEYTYDLHIVLILFSVIWLFLPVKAILCKQTNQYVSELLVVLKTP